MRKTRLTRLLTGVPRNQAASNAVFDLIGALTRGVFAATLLAYFWASAQTKLDGGGLSLNAYAQIFPRQMEAAGYDPSALGVLAHGIVWFGTLAEFALPVMICLGLFTRPAAVAMIGFVVVMSLTDVFGHGLGRATTGVPFDRFPDGLIADQRLFWTWALAVLTLTGGGYLSVDCWLRRQIGVSPAKT